MSRKPGIKTLLRVIGECQNLFGKIGGAASDRNPNRADDIARLTREGMQLCIDTRSHFPPEDVKRASEPSR